MFIAKVISRIEYAMYSFVSLLNFRYYSRKRCKKIYLFGVPVHGNLGDQAIVIAEREFLKKFFRGYRVIEIESNLVAKKLSYLKKNIDNSLILIHGGGFIGSIWPKEDKMAKMVIQNFNNNIIILPQTIYFDDNRDGRMLMEETKDIFMRKKNLCICSREEYSYDFMQSEFKNCNNYLIPDMVLFLRPTKKDKQKTGRVTLCLRNDIEKTFSNDGLLIKILKSRGFSTIDITDTVVNKRLYPCNRIKWVKKKIDEFSDSDIVVTDRLHGMVFAYLANTPCIVVNSKSHKVRGVYNWIKASGGIIMVNNEMELSEALDDIAREKDCKRVDLGGFYIHLKDIIEKMVD